MSLLSKNFGIRQWWNCISHYYNSYSGPIPYNLIEKLHAVDKLVDHEAIFQKWLKANKEATNFAHQ